MTNDLAAVGATRMDWLVGIAIFATIGQVCPPAGGFARLDGGLGKVGAAEGAARAEAASKRVMKKEDIVNDEALGWSWSNNEGLMNDKARNNWKGKRREERNDSEASTRLSRPFVFRIFQGYQSSIKAALKAIFDWPSNFANPTGLQRYGEMCHFVSRKSIILF